MTIIATSSGASGQTYTTLQSEVIDYLHRADLASKIPDFINRAESYLIRELHLKEMQLSVNGTTDSSGYSPLPADFGSVSRVTVTRYGRVYALDYVAVPDISTQAYPYPRYFSLENNQIKIWGAGVDQAFTLFYLPNIEHLSDTVTTNWITDNAPDLFFYSTALEGARYIRDAAEVEKLEPLVSSSLDSVKRFGERRGQPLTASLQIKPRRSW